MSITPRKSKNKDITPNDFITAYKIAIKDYKDSVWNLANLLLLGKKSFGRKALLELTQFDLSKIKWLISIGTTKRSQYLLPDHGVEVAGNAKAAYWLRRAEECCWTPLELRQAIRDHHSIYQDDNKSIKGIASYPKHTDMIQRELSKLSIEDKLKAVEYIKQQLFL